MGLQRKVRVLCIDAHQLMLDGMRVLFERKSDIEFVAGVRDFMAARDAVEHHRPDVVIVDVALPGGCAIAAVAECCKEHDGLRVVVHSACVHDGCIDAAIKAGVNGYICKSDSPSCLIEAVLDSHSREFYLSPTASERIAVGDGVGALQSKLSTVTPREMEVLRMIGLGMSRVEIADAIHRSLKTVDSHRASIMEKLGVDDRVQLALLAVREGLVAV
jgi:DNA-binding NarL/FixJ family response regulator